MHRVQALQEAERLKREEIRRKKEEGEREERHRQQLAAEEAQRIAATQLPVQMDALTEEGTGKGDGLTFVKRVSGRVMARNHNICRLISIIIIIVTAGQCPFNEAVWRAWRRIQRCCPGAAAASAVFASDFSFIIRRCGFKTGGAASCNRTSPACTSMCFPSLIVSV